MILGFFGGTEVLMRCINESNDRETGGGEEREREKREDEEEKKREENQG